MRLQKPGLSAEQSFILGVRMTDFSASAPFVEIADMLRIAAGRISDSP